MDFAFSDDEARESLIKLVTATGNQETSVRDLSLAMDIARGRNIDLAAATDIVIKASMGNVGALRRLGIQIDKGATSTEILTTLQERYAGQADAYASTTAGKFETAQKKVNNLLEDAGHLLIEVTAGAVDLADSVGSGMGAVLDEMVVKLDRAERGLRKLGITAEEFASQGPFTQFALGETAAALGRRLEFESELRRQGLANVAERAWEAEATTVGENIADDLTDAFKSRMRQREKDLEVTANIRSNLSTNIVDTLRGGGIKAVMKDLNWAINHPEKLAKFGEKLQEALDNPKLKAALGSDNPFLQLAGMQTQSALTDLWTNITGGADTSKDAVDALTESLRLLNRAIPSKRFDIIGSNPSRFSGKPLPALAEGGPANAGQTYLIGEKGPELLHMGNNSGHVTPNNQLGGSHGHTIVMDGQIVGRLLDERLGRQMAHTPAGVVNRG